MAYVYQINSDKGKQIAGNLGVGQSVTVGDGSTWTKGSDGKISVVTASGNKYDSNYTGNSGSSSGSSGGSRDTSNKTESSYFKPLTNNANKSSSPSYSYGGFSSSNKATNPTAAQPATNRYNTTITTPTGQKLQGYIENGITYTNDGKRIGEGYSSVDAQGRTWTIRNGVGVLNTNAENAYIQKYGTGTYAGNKNFVHDGMNIDMATDYSALMEEYKNDPQVLKILEEARNAKIARLQQYGITDYDPTEQYRDTALVDTSAMNRAYQQYAASQRGLQSGEINAANAAADAELAALAAQREQLQGAYSDDLRQLWIQAQLEQKTLEELLAARGISGGSAETAQLDLDSAYQSRYGNRAREYSGEIGDISLQETNIRNNLARNIAAIQSTYGSATAQAYADLVQQRAAAENEARAAIISRLGL